jgi:hypothetical protein
MNVAFFAATTAEFANHLRDLMWRAYGRPIKWALCIGLCVLILGPLIVFFKRLIR